MEWTIQFSRQVLKDTKKLRAANLEVNVRNLLNILRQNPYEPPYEKLSGNLQGY
jgi:toxin YoeB